MEELGIAYEKLGLEIPPLQWKTGQALYMAYECLGRKLGNVIQMHSYTSFTVLKLERPFSYTLGLVQPLLTASQDTRTAEHDPLASSVLLLDPLLDILVGDAGLQPDLADTDLESLLEDPDGHFGRDNDGDGGR